MNRITSKDLAYIGLFTALIAAGAFIRIPIPVVPFTLQILFTTLAGLLLGKRLGALSVGAYILLGLIGLPIFASGGGLGYIFMPTFGYLVGFCVGAYITGRIANASAHPSFKRLLVASFTGLLLVYGLGMAYYFIISNVYLHAPIGLWSLFLYCFLLPIPGDILLCFLAATIAKRMPADRNRG